MAHTDFSRIFVDRPILATVLSALLLVAGLIAIPNLPISEYPDMVPPSVQVIAMYPGANPRTIAETVAGPLEEAINGVDHMLYMKSTSSADGQMALTVTFRTGTDVDLATVQVQSRVAQVLQRLPAPVRALGVTTIKSSPALTMVVHVGTADPRFDPLYLSNFTNLRIRDEIARLPGIGRAVAFGAGTYAMRIWVDPNLAAARAVSAGDIVRAIREQNVEVSAGTIGGPPAPDGTALQLSINAEGRLASTEAFGDIVIRADGPRLTRLRDVARVELGSSTYALRALVNNQEGAAVAIYAAPGANTVAVSRAVRQRLHELEPGFPTGLHWSVPYDPTRFVRESIRAVIITLLEAVLLVVVVVVLFLRTWRASLIPLIAVPVSIIGACAALWALGFSINVLTLFGLVLAIGIVVDDAIVVVENVERHIEDGMTPRAAAHQAMSEVSGPVIAITLVLASVFVPLAFLGGITGEFYRQFAITIAAAVLISGFNSLTLSPALAALLLQPRAAPRDRFGRALERVVGRPFGAFQRLFQRGAARYNTGIGDVIGRAPRLLAIYGVLIVATLFAFRAVPGGYLPTQDKHYLFGMLQLPEASSIARTQATLRQLGEVALATPGVAYVVQFAGLNPVHFVPSPNSGTLFVGLTPPEQRELSAAEVATRINQAWAGIRAGFAFVLAPPPVQGLGTAAGLDLYVQDRGGAGYGELNGQTRALIGALAGTPGFDPLGTFSTFQSNVPQFDATVDRARARELGLALPDVFETLQVYLGSAYVNDFNLFGRTYSVYAQADAPFRDSVRDIDGLRVRNEAGAMVPLGSVVELRPGYRPDPVIRYNGYPAADLTVAFDAAVLSSTRAIEAVQQVAERVLAQGFAIEWTELTYQQMTQGDAVLLVFPLCVLLVYLVMAALYESWSLPLAIVLIVPLSLLSAIGGIWLVNFVHGLWLAISPPSAQPAFLDNNIFTKVGFAVLIGLACKNAILVVEFARDLEERGRDIVTAAVEAARLRLRPILMTSFAFIAGVLPLAFATGSGAEVRQVMGVTVVAGMLGVTFFGLFLTPVFYVVVRRSVERNRSWRVTRQARAGSSHD
ncbi:MAG: efflux RND transporter permease subunit [Gammaproteobacteria bacterium]|nr:efflux RND transporter permease subunit [Gammaproteobacteria bacterium]